MFHSRFQDIQDEVLEHPNNLFIVSNSKHSALVSLRGSTFLIEGDFSGTPEECEAEARAILTNLNKPRTRRRTREGI